jgi:iron complex outermembrane receptor protein
VQNKPVDNFAVFMQLTTGRVLRRKLSVTAGARYDLQLLSFADLSDPSHSTLSRDLSQVSPRLALVLFPWRDLVIKAMVDRAFRAPSPAELFAANTLITISNPKNLLPESITTLGLGAEDLVTRFLDLRANWFYEIFDNEVANSVVNGNSSTNVYSRTVTGVEAEALFDYAFGRAAHLGAFFNYTFVHLVNETIHDPTTFKSSDLTWAPAHVFNVGASVTTHGFSGSLQGHYQGLVERRTSDNAPVNYSAYRPESIAPWFTLDARVAYQITDWLRLGVQGTNLLNSQGSLIKIHNFPFDYQMTGVRVLGTMELTLGRLLPRSASL